MHCGGDRNISDSRCADGPRSQVVSLMRGQRQRLFEALCRVEADGGPATSRVLKKRLAAASGIGRLEAASGFVIVAS